MLPGRDALPFPAAAFLSFTVVFVAAFASSTNVAAQPTFVDVTSAAGLDWLHWDGNVPPDLPPGDREVWMMAGAAAAGSTLTAATSS